jgi:hypothetical protein
LIDSGRGAVLAHITEAVVEAGRPDFVHLAVVESIGLDPGYIVINLYISVHHPDHTTMLASIDLANFDSIPSASTIANSPVDHSNNTAHHSHLSAEANRYQHLLHHCKLDPHHRCYNS